MSILWYLIQKEFKQIFRNKGMLPIIFILPILQLVILSNAATFEIKNIRLGYVDNDCSPSSRALMQKFDASDYFEVIGEYSSQNGAQHAMQDGLVDIVINVPDAFERGLYNGETVILGSTINAIDGAAAGVMNVYVQQLVMGYQKNIGIEMKASLLGNNKPISIQSIPSFWYNHTLNYKTFMVPGILVLLVTMITLFLSGMNIVREKEIGTLEQINVTPIKKGQFIIGKLFPFWVLGMIILSVGLGISKLVFNVPMLGSMWLLYVYTGVYILVILGMGLFISNFTETQQQAMFIAWFFAVIFILLSGLFTPIESMPPWAQRLTELNPIRYFVEVIRMVMLKGSGLSEMTPQLIKTVIYAVVMNLLAVWSYKKVN